MQALASIYDGWIAVKLWTWFIVPASPTIPHLSIEFFIGVSYLAHLLFKKRLNDKNRGLSEIARDMIGSLALWPTILLLTAYLVHWWI